MLAVLVYARITEAHMHTVHTYTSTYICTHTPHTVSQRTQKQAMYTLVMRSHNNLPISACHKHSMHLEIHNIETMLNRAYRLVHDQLN